MEKETKKSPEEIAEEFVRQYQPSAIRYDEPDHSCDASFAKQLERAKEIISKLKFPPDWHEDKD